MMLRRAARGLGPALKRQWIRIPLRGIHFADQHDRLDLLYRVRDPWEMDSDPQRFRFRETNRVIEERLSPVHSVLEVGCGEGHQTEWLLRVCEALVGIDVSRRAVGRARERCPSATFAVGDVFSSEPPLRNEPFDLVVACEVLYYMSDVPSVLQRLSALGRACLVSYYDAPAERLDPDVLSLPGVERELVHYGEAKWTVAWWRNP
jgi:SAM-dependent methyltransferase